jgi:O-antigen ligase
MNTVLFDIYNNFRDNINFRRLLIFLLPIALIIGSAFVNFILVLIFFIFLYDLIKKKNFYIFKYNWVIFFLIFWLYIVLLSLFSSGFDGSLKNSFSQIRFLTLTLFIYQNFNLKSYTLFFSIIFACILLVGIDNNIQFFTGLDIFGYPAEGYSYNVRIFELKATDPYFIGRLSGPFRDELISGAFLVKLGIVVLFYLASNFQKFSNRNKFFFILLILFILQSILITGERTSSILFICLLFILLFNLISFKKAFIVSIILTFFISLLIVNSNFLKNRSNDTINILSDYKNSSYGRLASSSFHLWKKNLLFGVGLKNYRVECDNLIDPFPDHKFQYCSSHPHNTFLELLSETGIFGIILYLLFIFFFFWENNIRISKKLKANSYGLMAFILLSLVPILPSGSLFTTWNASFFWIILGLYLSLAKEKIQ